MQNDYLHKIRMHPLVLIVFISFFFNLIAQEFKLKFENYAILKGDEGQKLFRQCSRGSHVRKSKKAFLFPDSIISFIKQDFHQLDTMRTDAGGIRHIEYRYQLTSFKIKKQLYIYINALPEPSQPYKKERWEEYWKEKAIIICDGGKSYWGVVYNVTKRKFENLAFNGPHAVWLD